MVLKKLRELKKLKNYNLIDQAVPIIDFICPIKYSPNGKFDNRYFLICMIDFIETQVSWNKYRGTIEYPMKGKYLNQIHNKWANTGVYDELDKIILNRYLKTDRESKLKNQMIDSFFVQNKQGSVKNNNHLLTNKEKENNKKIKEHNKTASKKNRKKEKTFINFNSYNGRKKYFKCDTITDTYGTIMAHSVSSATNADGNSLKNLVEKLPATINTLKNSKVNRYKQNFLGDSAYDTKKNKDFLKKRGYNVAIKYNSRNTKDKKIIKKNQFNAKQKKIFKGRYVIEASNAWIKNHPVVGMNYQKKIESFNGLFTLSCILINSKRI